MVAFETCLTVARVVAREGDIDRYAVDGSGGINFMAEFCVLEGQLGFGGEW